MNSKRIKRLLTKDQPQGEYVLYWMQQSQRIHFNHALEYAVHLANEYDVPLVVLFCLTDYPSANKRHYQFMLEGLQSLVNPFKDLNITFIIQNEDPVTAVYEFAKNSIHTVFDMGYLRIQRSWRNKLYTAFLNTNMTTLDVVESDLVVPIKEASDKLEYGARTIRKKLMSQYQHYLDDVIIKPVQQSLNHHFSSLDLSNIDAILDLLNLVDIPISKYYQGGQDVALKRLKTYFKEDINNYPNSNDPSLSLTSRISMYLHFGQLSSTYIIKQLENLHHAKNVTTDAYESFLEQLLVRRELSFNFVYYNKNYDDFNFITYDWAYQTMNTHLLDERDYIYTIDDYLAFATHDPYFNAAMKQMVMTGYMHNYMRMYWAKKIIEWSHTYQEAYHIIKSLNDTYFLDGRDANGYTGIAWCFGRHDRAWTERDIFGKLRYMNANGLKRKFDIESYVEQMNNLQKKQ